MTSSSRQSSKVGQEYGEVRSSLPLENLVPYLEKNVEGYIGPLEVKQFKVGPRHVFTIKGRQQLILVRSQFGQACIRLGSAHGCDLKYSAVKPHISPNDSIEFLRPPSSTDRTITFTHRSSYRPGISHAGSSKLLQWYTHI